MLPHYCLATNTETYTKWWDRVTKKKRPFFVFGEHYFLRSLFNKQKWYITYFVTNETKKISEYTLRVSNSGPSKASKYRSTDKLSPWRFWGGFISRALHDFPRNVESCLSSRPDHVLNELYLLSFKPSILVFFIGRMRWSRDFPRPVSSIPQPVCGLNLSSWALDMMSGFFGLWIPIASCSSLNKTLLASTGEGGMLTETDCFLCWFEMLSGLSISFPLGSCQNYNVK